MISPPISAGNIQHAKTMAIRSFNATDSMLNSQIPNPEKGGRSGDWVSHQLVPIFRI
jgi:hypothetical protein